MFCSHTFSTTHSTLSVAMPHQYKRKFYMSTTISHSLVSAITNARLVLLVTATVMTSPRKEGEICNRSITSITRIISTRTQHQHHQDPYEQDRSPGTAILQTAGSTHSSPLESRGSSSTLASFDEQCKPAESREDTSEGGGECGTEDILSIARRLQRSLITLRGDQNDNTAPTVLEDVNNRQEDTLDCQAGQLLITGGTAESLSDFLRRTKQQQAESTHGVPDDYDDCSFQSFDSLKYYRREKSSSTLLSDEMP